MSRYIRAERRLTAILHDWRALALLYVLANCAAGLAAFYFRGPWLDEFATRVFADPSIPFAKAWSELWPTESNPPFFYMIARLVEGVAGDSLLARRAANTLPLVAMLGWFSLIAYRRPELRSFLALFAVFAFGGRIFLQDLPYYRSYFWQYAAEVCFIGATVVAYVDRSARLAWVQLLAVPFLLLLHQITAIYAAALIAALFVVDFKAGHWRRVAGWAIVGALSLGPLALFATSQWAHAPQVMSRVAWISAKSSGAALVEILNVFPSGLAQNGVAALGAIYVLATKLRPIGPWRGIALLMASCGAIATAVVLCINLFEPIVVQRYFSFPVVELAACLAIVLQPLAHQNPRFALAMLLNATVFLVGYGFPQIHKKMWERGGEIVGGIVQDCPSTRVRGGAQPADERESVGLAYLGRRHGFSVLPVAPDAPGDCPVLYWSEGNAPTEADLARFGGSLARATNFTANYGLPESLLSQAAAIRSNNGVILMVGGSQELKTRWKAEP
jgi:hypothetical protein